MSYCKNCGHYDTSHYHHEILGSCNFPNCDCSEYEPGDPVVIFEAKEVSDAPFAKHAAEVNDVAKWVHNLKLSTLVVLKKELNTAYSGADLFYRTVTYSMLYTVITEEENQRFEFHRLDLAKAESGRS
jgi:hypothetical protein